MMHRRLGFVLLIGSALLLAAGCDSSSSSGAHDAGVDADAGADAGRDSGSADDSGTGADAGGDAGPGEEGRCPAYPAMPDAACTGVIPGTTLRDCDGHITESNATYTDCLFPEGIVIASNVESVQISNSRIEGVISPQTMIAPGLRLVLTDVEIDGNEARQAAWGFGADVTCVRCNVHNAAIGFQYDGYTIIDSYVHDLYGFGDSHNEAILVGGGDVVIRHSTLEGNFGSNSTGGGMSASIAMYTHGDFWGPLDQVRLENNRIITSDAYYCLYGGHSSDTDGRPSNIQVVGNVFGPCSFEGPQRGAVVGWLRGNGNVWRDNSWDDGTAIPEPDTSPYE